MGLNVNLLLFASKDANKEMADMEDGLSKIQELAKHLATHFCESEATFQVEECVGNMKTFCEKVQQCQKVFISQFW